MQFSDVKVVVVLVSVPNLLALLLNLIPTGDFLTIQIFRPKITFFSFWSRWCSRALVWTSCSSFLLFCFLGEKNKNPKTPNGPKANTTPHTYLQFATSATTLRKFRGIYLYCCHKLKKNLKKTVSTKGNTISKSISAPVRTMAYFAFFFFTYFFFSSFVFPPIILSMDNFIHFETNNNKKLRRK